MKNLVNAIINFIASFFKKEVMAVTTNVAATEPTINEWVEAMNSLDTADIKYFARPVKGLAEIYSRINPEKREVYKNAIMSGLFFIEEQGEEFVPLVWCPGEYRSNATAMTKVERREKGNNPVWVDLPWAVVCRMYR